MECEYTSADTASNSQPITSITSITSITPLTQRSCANKGILLLVPYSIWMMYIILLTSDSSTASTLRLQLWMGMWTYFLAKTICMSLMFYIRDSTRFVNSISALLLLTALCELGGSMYWVVLYSAPINCLWILAIHIIVNGTFFYLIPHIHPIQPIQPMNESLYPFYHEPTKHPKPSLVLLSANCIYAWTINFVTLLLWAPILERTTNPCTLFLGWGGLSLLCLHWTTLACLTKKWIMSLPTHTNLLTKRQTICIYWTWCLSHGLMNCMTMGYLLWNTLFPEHFDAFLENCTVSNHTSTNSTNLTNTKLEVLQLEPGTDIANITEAVPNLLGVFMLVVGMGIVGVTLVHMCQRFMG